MDVNRGAFPFEGEELYVTCTSGEQSPFLEEIDGGTYRQRVWPAEA